MVEVLEINIIMNLKKMESKDIETKIRSFLTDRALPIITHPKSGDTVHLISKRPEENYYLFLDKRFDHITVWDKEAKHCKCVEEIIERKGMTLLQLIIFIVKHNVSFSSDCSGYYDGGSDLDDACFFYLDKKNHIDIGFRTHEDLLSANLTSIVKGAFYYLKGKHCNKYYRNLNKHSSHRIGIDANYWKLQAELFYKGLPPLSNKGCYGRKAGITPNEECKDCKYFAFLEYFHHCDFDYWKRYGVHRTILLPDDGKTYACKHFLRNGV